ncbi:MAG TPA: hypothetical protein P5571_02630 [Candidatus Krumholzibacteria bacterium]|nr:hypothetical protein [Candidatus Krumholzibacteria bacterium]HRX50239.1 hypothetical protein [Candidatus Krumholzibacteria bacterium]
MSIDKTTAWLAAGLASIVAGYVVLGTGDTTVAPLLLILGYCVLVPVYLLKSFLQTGGE